MYIIIHMYIITYMYIIIINNYISLFFEVTQQNLYVHIKTYICNKEAFHPDFLVIRKRLLSNYQRILKKWCIIMYIKTTEIKRNYQNYFHDSTKIYCMQKKVNSYHFVIWQASLLHNFLQILKRLIYYFFKKRFMVTTYILICM